MLEIQSVKLLKYIFSDYPWKKTYPMLNKETEKKRDKTG